MRRVASGLVLLLAVFLVAGCTWFQTPQRHKTTASHTPVAGTSGTPTPETSASPAESPSPSPSPGATATPTSTPAPTATPYAPLVIKSLPFHGGDVGYGYRSVTAVGGGGKLPYTWSISSGSLPPGLSMSSDGVTT